MKTNLNTLNLTFLIDTQADISLIKQSSITKEILVNKKDIIHIKGVTNNIIDSLGSVLLNFTINNELVTNKLFIVPDNFAIPSDGILGKDFLKPRQSILNYRTMTLIFKNRNSFLSLNLLDSMNNNLYIPPRCETTRQFTIANIREENLYIPNQIIIDGLYIPNTIVKSNKILVPILNTTNSFKVMPKNYQLQYFPLNDYNVLNIQNSSQTKSDTQRTELLLNLVKENTDSPFQSQIQNLCSNFVDIFALDSDPLTTNNFYEQKLRVLDNQPVYIKNYRLPYAQKAEVNKQVQKLLNDGLIEPSRSNFNSPVILVPKKGDGSKWRMCIDYRMVNRKLIADKYPLPRIEEILDSLGRSKFFSVLDLQSGFHQIPIEENSRDITSFSTDNGAFRFKVLPFGLNISPNSFTRMMNIAFSGLSPERCFIYMDDIIVTGCSASHHIKNLSAVFETCRKYNLKLNATKCRFFKKEVMYIGHVVNEKGVQPDPIKIEALKNYPVPSSKDDVRRFVAFANFYRRFIPNFAAIAQPLNELTRKRSIFEWSESAQKSFDNLRLKLIKFPILHYPDFTKEFKIVVDASNSAVGACLMQEFGNFEHPISYASRSLTKGELNKSTIEKELTAIHFAITHFRPYIFGRHFVVKSDHKPLTYLFSLKNPSSKLTRMRLDLEEYDFSTEYIKGTANVIADALSRINVNEIRDLSEQTTSAVLAVTTRSKNKQQQNTMPDKCVENELLREKTKGGVVFRNHSNRKIPKLKITFSNNNFFIKVFFKRKLLIQLEVYRKKIQALAPLFKILNEELGKTDFNEFEINENEKVFELCDMMNFIHVGNQVLNKINLSIVKSPILIENLEEKKEIIRKYHIDPIVGGHSGTRKLFAKIRSRFFWKNMAKDVANFVKNCKECQFNKASFQVKQKMEITRTPNKVYEELIIDTIGPLNVTENGNRYALTAICGLSKFLIMVPMPNKEASTVAKALIDNCLLTYGMPKRILSDRGTEYANAVMNELCKTFKIKHVMSTAYHPETLGCIERTHRTLNEYLRSYLDENKTNWDVLIKYFSFCHNITPHESFQCKYTPFEIMFSRDPNIFDNLNKREIDPIYNIDDIVALTKFNFQRTSEIARDYLLKSKNVNKKHYDRKIIKEIEIKVGDSVLLKNESRKKLDSLYVGPFLVKKIEGVNVEIENENGQIQLVHMNRVKLFY